MAKKYELVELDGRFGLMAKGTPDLSNTRSGAYAVLLDAQGQVSCLRKDGQSFYNDYLITRDTFSFSTGNTLTPQGATHYLGQRMSLEQYERTSPTELSALYGRFCTTHPDLASHYERTRAGRLRGLFGSLVSGYQKVEQLADQMQEQNLNQLDAQIPGFRAGYEHAVLKLEKISAQMESKLNERLDAKDAERPVQDRQLSLSTKIADAASGTVHSPTPGSHTKEIGTPMGRGR